MFPRVTSRQEGLRHQVFLGSAAFGERHCVHPKPLARLRELQRAQLRTAATPLAEFADWRPAALAKPIYRLAREPLD